MLRSEDLLRKSGFGDGDAPDDLLDRLEARGVRADGLPWRAALCRLVRQHLLPALDQRVEVVHLAGIHNPVRAALVDGADVTPCWTGLREPPVLTPDSVTVPIADVLALLDDMLTRLDAPARATLAEVVRRLERDAAYYSQIGGYEVQTQKTQELADAIECAISFVDGVGAEPTPEQRYEIGIWVEGGILLDVPGPGPAERRRAAAALVAAIEPSVAG